MKDRLQKIFDKTDGRCHLCHKPLEFKNFGVYGSLGAWHREHSVPRFLGGTDHLNNLFPSCIKCNLKKGIKSTRSERAKHGLSRAPYSKKRKRDIAFGNTLKGGLVGGLIGLVVNGKKGMVCGAVIGGSFGYCISPIV